MHINWIGKSSELKLHCFCLFDAYSMPKDSYSVASNFFGPQKVEKTTSKNYLLMAVGSFSLQLNFPFINFFIQPSCVESLGALHCRVESMPLLQ